MKYLIGLFLVIFVGCTAAYPGEDKLDKIDKIVAKRLTKEYGLLPFGIGASWPDKCHAIAYDYNYESTVPISEARKLLLDAAQVIIESATSVEEFEQYLLNPPFNVKHIMLSISFYDPIDVESDDPQIKLASLMFGKIWYENLNKEAYRYDSIYEETHEEALQRARDEILKKDSILKEPTSALNQATPGMSQSSSMQVRSRFKGSSSASSAATSEL